jgi:hypothetical protein
MTRTLLTLLAATFVLALPASGQAAVTVGIGDQSPTMFSDPNFRALNVKHARVIVPYDAVSVRSDRDHTDAWLAAARAAGVTPLISFEHSRVHPTKRPSVKEYTAAFKAFRARYPWVKTYSPFNEANHKSQPTFHRAKLAAQYYNAVRANCRGCKIVALDVLDQSGLADYVKTFRRTAKKPKIWGLHNYGDTNRNRVSGTSQLLNATKGDVWLTETGGIVAFSNIFSYDLARAARSLQQMFSLSVSSKRIKALYIYAWGGEPRGARFDAGLVGPDGKTRPGYDVVKKNIAKGRVKTKKKLRLKLVKQKPAKVKKNK